MFAGGKDFFDHHIGGLQVPIHEFTPNVQVSQRFNELRGNKKGNKTMKTSREGELKMHECMRKFEPFPRCM